MFSALERLRKLRAGECLDGADQPLLLTVADLSPEWRLEFEERAAIREYDGGQAREHAEAEALKEILAKMRQNQTGFDTGPAPDNPKEPR